MLPFAMEDVVVVAAVVAVAVGEEEGRADLLEAQELVVVDGLRVVVDSDDVAVVVAAAAAAAEVGRLAVRVELLGEPLLLPGLEFVEVRVEAAVVVAVEEEAVVVVVAAAAAVVVEVHVQAFEELLFRVVSFASSYPVWWRASSSVSLSLALEIFARMGPTFCVLEATYLPGPDCHCGGARPRAADTLAT